jgi:hypothetical protein
MLKKIEIILWIASAIFAYAVFLTVFYTDLLGFYEKIVGTIIPVAYINAVGVHIWNRI